MGSGSHEREGEVYLFSKILPEVSVDFPEKLQLDRHIAYSTLAPLSHRPRQTA